MTSLGGLIPQLLKARGFDTVFGIPGVHTIELYRALGASGIRHITPRHEQGAGFMADGYARAGGRVAACFVITGPGVTNIATAMAQARADSVPMLVISGVNRRDELGLGEGRLHELPDQQALAAGVSVASHHLAHADQLPGALDEALRVFHAARPGPVHIQVPVDLLAEPAPAAPPQPGPQPLPPAPEAALIRRAAAELEQAERPLLLLGGGALDAADEVAMLLDKLPMPVLLTIAGKGLVPPEHPCLIGSCLPLAPIREAVRDAELLLAVGTELGETDSLLFGDTLQLRGRLLRVDLDPLQFQRRPKTDLALPGAAAAVLDALAKQLPATSDEVRAVRHQQAAELGKAARAAIPEEYLLHGRLLELVQARLPNALLVGDSTQPIYGANLSFNAGAPRRYFNSTTGYGTLGYALPAAIGARLGRPDALPVCIIGDGGLQFSLPELLVAKELRIPLIVLIWNNDGYEEIRRSMREAGMEPVGVDPSSPDLAAIAAGYGCGYRKPLTQAEFELALADAAGLDAPCLLEMPEAPTLAWLAGRNPVN